MRRFIIINEIYSLFCSYVHLLRLIFFNLYLQMQIWWLITTLECWMRFIFAFYRSDAYIVLNRQYRRLILIRLIKLCCIWTNIWWHHIFLFRLILLCILNLVFSQNFSITFNTLIKHRYILKGLNLIFLVLILVIVIFNYWINHVVCVHLHNIEETVVVDISDAVIKALVIRVDWYLFMHASTLRSERMVNVCKHFLWIWLI